MQRRQASNLAIEVGVAMARWDSVRFLCGVFFGNVLFF
jgi:hypothetical protein